MKILLFPIIPGGVEFFILSVYRFTICWQAKRSFGRSRLISRKELIRQDSEYQTGWIETGVLYHDGQFDDARLAVSLALTAIEQGATVLNYFRVCGLTKEADKISGVVARDQETGIAIYTESKNCYKCYGCFCR